MEQVNTLTINGHEYPFDEGDTILDVARRNGIFIPTLCQVDGAANTGACRVCLVEVEGARGLAASCAMPAGAGMKVLTESPKVVEARTSVLALLMVSGNHNCAARGVSDDDWTDFQAGVRDYDRATDICDAYGTCELQALAYRYQVGDLVSELRLRSLETDYPIEMASPFIVRDFSRCILCGRCVKACNEIRHNNAISYGYRGANAKIVTRGDKSLCESDCVFCGECIQRCPVGALVEKDSRYETRPWTLSRVRSTCGYCSTGCGVDFFTKDGKIVMTSGTEAGPSRGALCVRGRYGNDFVGHPDRLKRPLIRRDDTLQPAVWDEALGFVAEKLKSILETNGPGAIAACASTRISNEDAYAMQKFFRTVVGTNNIDNASRLTDAPAAAALGAVFGVPAMTNSFAEVEASDVILLAGSDAAHDHPVVASRIKRAAAKGAVLLVVDPGESTMGNYARVHLRPKPGPDVAWMNGFLRVILEEGLFEAEDMAGLAGFAELKEAVNAYTPDHVARLTGIDKEHLVEAARLYGKAGRAAIYHGSGLTQHGTGTDCVKALANLALLCGNIGIEGGGVNPLLSQCNTQGVCDMGGLPDSLPGHKKIEGPDAGLSILEALKSIEEGTVKALYLVGESPLAALPRPVDVARTLQKLELLVVQDMFMSDACSKAHVVLPSASFAESEGTFTSAERRVQRIRKAVPAPGEAREDWRIFADLAAGMGQGMDVSSSAVVFDEIARTIPEYAGLSHARLDVEGGLQWPCPTAEHPGTRFLFKGGQFKSGPSFQAVEYAPPAEVPNVEYPYLLVAGEVLGFHHLHTKLGNHLSDGAVVVSPQDADKLGLKDEGRVKLTSRRGTAELPVRISTRFPAGIVYLPLRSMGSEAARLLSRTGDAVAGTPAYKACAVRMQGTRNEAE